MDDVGSDRRGGLRTIYAALPLRRKRDAWLTAALMLVGSFAEVLSIGAVLPFLAVLVDPQRLFTLPVIGGLFRQLSPETNLVTLCAVLFLGLVVVSAGIRLLLAWFSQAFAFNAAADLAGEAFRRIIRQPYPFYMRHHSSEILTRFEMIHHLTYGVLVSGVQALISTVAAAMLIIFLILVDPSIALLSAGVLIGTYVLATLLVRRRLAANSLVISDAWNARVKQVQEALGGIRDILIDRTQQAHDTQFATTSNRLRGALTTNAYINTAPRIVIELAGILLIGGLALGLARQPGGLLTAIPTLGALALGGQRLLPLLQQAYVGWSQFRGSDESMKSVAMLVSLPDLPVPAVPPGPPFQQQIAFKSVNFAYEPGRPVLRDITFAVRRGERVGIVGPTGSGKSSLMDLLLALLEPSHGDVLVDGASLRGERRAWWQAQVAHVPQSIYLTDDSVAANIALGVAEDAIDMDLVAASARSAGIDAFIRSLPNGYAASCGECGIRLSGGQRQRIGIARALYKRASVLLFDEATSALDHDTEQAVMAAIADLPGELTIIMIAHRLSTLGGCDRILCLEGGRIAREVRSITEIAPADPLRQPAS